MDPELEEEDILLNHEAEDLALQSLASGSSKTPKQDDGDRADREAADAAESARRRAAADAARLERQRHPTVGGGPEVMQLPDSTPSRAPVAPPPTTRIPVGVVAPSASSEEEAAFEAMRSGAAPASPVESPTEAPQVAPVIPAPVRRPSAAERRRQAAEERAAAREQARQAQRDRDTTQHQAMVTPAAPALPPPAPDSLFSDLAGPRPPTPEVVQPAPTVPGNIPLQGRPELQNPDGTISTVDSIGIGTPDGEVEIPTVIDGRRLTDAEAEQHYRETGEHLGIYPSIEAGDAAGQAIHEDQATEHGLPPGPPSPPPSADRLAHPEEYSADGDFSNPVAEAQQYFRDNPREMPSDADLSQQEASLHAAEETDDRALASLASQGGSPAPIPPPAPTEAVRPESGPAPVTPDTSAPAAVVPPREGPAPLPGAIPAPPGSEPSEAAAVSPEVDDAALTALSGRASSLSAPEQFPSDDEVFGPVAHRDETPAQQQMRKAQMERDFVQQMRPEDRLDYGLPSEEEVERARGSETGRMWEQRFANAFRAAGHRPTVPYQNRYEHLRDQRAQGMRERLGLKGQQRQQQNALDAQTELATATRQDTAEYRQQQLEIQRLRAGASGATERERNDPTSAVSEGMRLGVRAELQVMSPAVRDRMTQEIPALADPSSLDEMNYNQLDHVYQTLHRIGVRGRSGETTRAQAEVGGEGRTRSRDTALEQQRRYVAAHLFRTQPDNYPTLASATEYADNLFEDDVTTQYNRIGEPTTGGSADAIPILGPDSGYAVSARTFPGGASAINSFNTELSGIERMGYDLSELNDIHNSFASQGAGWQDRAIGALGTAVSGRATRALAQMQGLLTNTEHTGVLSEGERRFLATFIPNPSDIASETLGQFSERMNSFVGRLRFDLDQSLRDHGVSSEDRPAVISQILRGVSGFGTEGTSATITPRRGGSTEVGTPAAPTSRPAQTHTTAAGSTTVPDSISEPTVFERNGVRSTVSPALYARLTPAQRAQLHRVE